MTYWEVPRMWTGDCWIIGGGNSVFQQFDVPLEVVEKTRSGELPYSTLGDYLFPLHHRNVIGVNAAFKLGEWISVAYFCDTGFFQNHKEDLLAFRNLKVTCIEHIYRELWPWTLNIKRMKRDYKPGLSSKRDTICWNCNSGGAAINFAVLAGAKRILLLGFDMSPQSGRTHWHNLYPEETTEVTFKRFMRYFPAIAEDAKNRGVEILNVSPNSELEAFRKVALKDVL